MITGFAREAVRRGSRVGPTWAPALQRSRASFEKIRAPWWLAELDKLQAAAS